MQKLIVYPYKIGSESAKKLARELGVIQVFPDRNYKYYPNHVIINWGNGALPHWDTPRVKYLNHPSKVSISANKITALKTMKDQGVSIPIFFTNKEELIRYTVGLPGFPTIYCRTNVRGHSGSGIVLANAVSEIIPAPLYTIRFKAKREWRVHVFKDQVIDFAKKSKRTGEEADRLIRSYANGWVFRREGLELPEALATMAKKAIVALGLDFGAVDIAEDKNGRVCVYEVNSAPGMELGSTTLRKYVNVFREYVDSIS
jgi:glutathione synthase/RimK-type ligase-like ATP-grasp enzyme